MDGLKKEMRDARLSLDKEFREKMDEIRDMRNRVKELASAQSRMHSELKSSDAELTQQLAVMVESLQEEQGIRNSEDRELEEAVKALRLNIEAVGRKAADEDLREEQALEEIARRLDEQNKAWNAEAGKLRRGVDDERTEREQGHDKLKMSISRLQQNLDDEQGQRLTGFQQMQGQIEQIEETVAQETKETVRSMDQLSDRVSAVRRALTDEQKDRLTADQDINSK